MIPREDDISQLKSVPSGVLEDEILTGTVVDEDHEHNGDSTQKENGGIFENQKIYLTFGKVIPVVAAYKSAHISICGFD